MKSKVFKEIDQIKKKHIKWHAYAEAIVLNFETESNLLPKAYTDCDFGKWYYGEGQFLSFIEAFIDLEEIHIKLHNLYLSIYKQMLNPKKKILHFYKKDNNLEIKQSVFKLKRFSELIIEKFDDIKIHISQMDEEEFNSKYH